MACIDYIHRIVQPLPQSVLEYFPYPQEKACPRSHSLSLAAASPGQPLVSRPRICLLGSSVDSHARRLWCCLPFLSTVFARFSRVGARVRISFLSTLRKPVCRGTSSCSPAAVHVVSLPSGCGRRAARPCVSRTALTSAGCGLRRGVAVVRHVLGPVSQLRSRKQS